MKPTKRQVLASLGLIGGSAALGGYGTLAYFSDEESSTTIATAGELDIKLDWKAYHDTGDGLEQIAMQEPTDADGVVAAEFEDIKPGDTGCFALSIHNETNPAWVWLAMEITDETDGGTPGEGLPQCPVSEYPLVCGQSETDGNVTVQRQGDSLVVTMHSTSGEEWTETHLEVAQDDSGIPASGGGSPQPGQFTYSNESSGDTHEYEVPLEEISAKCDDELVIAAHGASTSGETCWGGSTEFDPSSNQWALVMTHTVCCEESVASDPTSEAALADNMLVDVFWDDDEDCEIDDGETVLYREITMRDLANNIAKDTGGIHPQWYSDGTQYISIRWHVPFEVGNVIQQDELELEFCVYAAQRRHNDDPDNPWV